MIRDITAEEIHAFNSVANHPLQAYEWGEFRKKTNIRVVRKGFFSESGKLEEIIQLTIHPIPHTPWTIGYFPKGPRPTAQIVEELKRIGKQEHCISIQLEPNVEKLDSPGFTNEVKKLGLIRAAHPLFTKFTFLLNLSQPEEELLKNMHSKTRYNIRVAQKHTVEIVEDNSPEAFERYLELTEETTRRQGFYAHTQAYHRQQWASLSHSHNTQELTSHLLVAKYQEKILTAWIVFIFKDHLYYPYGASSSEHREVMHSTLMMWGAIEFGKKYNLKEFDMWGAAMVPNPPPTDPYYGFHRFKQNFGPRYTEFVGSYDLVLQPLLYSGYKIADKVRWLILRLRK